jgi:phospholipase C
MKAPERTWHPAQLRLGSQQAPEWAETAVFIQPDDSDGWYDHVIGPVINPSATGNIPGQDDAATNANGSMNSRDRAARAPSTG